MKLVATRQLSLGLVSLLFCLALCGRARAFQNPGRFIEDPVDKGGGGQRFFTGSPADGYTCKACHAPGEPVPVDVAGLPIDGYVPGRAYPITIKWPDELESVALNAEFTDQSGAALGKVSIPAASQLTPADLCRAGRMSGANVLPLPTRSVLVLTGCGQHQTTLLWTAPDAPPAGSGWFSGSLVVSDGNGDLAGDRVADFRRVLSVAGAVASVSSSASGNSESVGCSALARPHGDSSAAALVLALAVVWLSCSRSRRR